MRTAIALLLLITAGTAQAGIVAQYETRQAGNADAETHQWWVLREDHRIEFRSGDGRVSEIWRKESDGYSLIRVFHPSKRAVHYTPSDLRALQVQPDWQALISLSEPGVEVISRDEALNLPRERRKARDGQQFVDTLKQSWASAEAPQQPTELKRYQVMDFSDLGDNEADPFFRQFIQMGPVAHKHHQH